MSSGFRAWRARRAPDEGDLSAQEMRKQTRQAVESGHHQHVAASNSGQSLGELRPRRFGTRHIFYSRKITAQPAVVSTSV
jgi:hypothetical protein